MAEIYEKCALCGKLTSVLKKTPISKRYGYIEGAGQLCSRCFKEFCASSPEYRITAQISDYLKNNKQ